MQNTKLEDWQISLLNQNIALPMYWISKNKNWTSVMCQYITLDDIKQELYLILIDAAKKFRPELGYAFTTYAMFRMSKSKSDISRKYTTPEQYLDDENFDILLSPFEENGYYNIEESMNAEALLTLLKNKIKNHNDFVVVSLLAQGLTQVEIAHKLNVSRQCVSARVCKLKNHIREVLYAN